MEHFLAMQTQISQATSRLITSIQQVMAGPTSAPRSHRNSIIIDGQEILSAPLTLISHLEGLAEVQNQLLPRLSQLMNPGQQVLEAHKELVLRQVAKEQRDVQFSHLRTNQRNCYYHKHFGFPYFQDESSDEARRSKHPNLSSDQDVKVPPHLKDSLMLNLPTVDELQRVHIKIHLEYSEHAQMRKKALDEYLEGWTITLTEFQPCKRKRYRKQIRKAKIWKRSNRGQGQEQPHQAHNDPRTQAQMSQVQQRVSAGEINHVVAKTKQDDDQDLLGAMENRMFVSDHAREHDSN